MSNVDKMRDMIGNHFDLILVASERLRELQRQRKLQEELEKVDKRYFNTDNFFEERKKREIPYQRTFKDIESGAIGREYLNKVKSRIQPRKKQKFDHLEN
jgi:hypothetical protein